jgi:hypothetical protein
VQAVALDAGVSIPRMCSTTSTVRRSPASALVELIAFTIEGVDTNPALALLIRDGGPNRIFDGKITDDIAVRYARSMIRSLDIDWKSVGFDEEALDELIMWALLVTDAIITAGQSRVGTGAELRAYLWRWFAPAVEQATTNSKRRKILTRNQIR